LYISIILSSNTGNSPALLVTQNHHQSHQPGKQNWAADKISHDYTYLPCIFRTAPHLFGTNLPLILQATKLTEQSTA
jgi:hypothetical protein